ncbi:MAG: YfhO family protein, partial [Chlamydiota bacterium]
TFAYVRFVTGNRAGALLSAVVFIFSGPYLLQLFPGHIFNPLPWLPLSLLFGELAVRRKRAVWYLLAGCVLGLQVLAGHPQYAAYCAGALVLYVLFRSVAACREEWGMKPLAGAAAGVVLMIATGAALSAVQLFPGMEFAAESGRAHLAGPASVRDNSLPPENLALLAVPGLFGDMQGVRYWGRWLYWETCLYVGIFPLLLALVGAVRSKDHAARFFAGLAIVSLVLAFGAYSPLFGFLYARVPGFSLFRAQAKFIALAAFSLAVLAGFGCRCLLDRGEETRRLIARFGAASMIIALALALLAAAAAATGGGESPLWGRVVLYRHARGFEGTPPIDPADTASRAASYRTALRGALTASAIFLLSGAVFLSARRMKPAPLAAAVLLLSIGDLWHFGARYIIVSPLESCRWPPDLAASMRSDRSVYRICAPNISVPGAMQNIREGVAAIDGYETLNVGLYKDYVDASQGVRRGARIDFAIDGIAPMLEALNLKYLLLPAPQRFAFPGYRRRFTDGRVTVYEKEAPSPRAFVVHRARVIPEPDAALAALRMRGEAVRDEVILSADPGVPLPAPAPGSPRDRAEIVAEHPSEVRVAAELSCPGFLVLSDVYYPGWRAYVDGKDAPIRRANYAFRAVHLGEGTHEVRFVYAPRSFAIGLRVSAAAALLVGIALARAAFGGRARPLSDVRR